MQGVSGRALQRGNMSVSKHRFQHHIKGSLAAFKHPVNPVLHRSDAVRTRAHHPDTVRRRDDSPPSFGRRKGPSETFAPHRPLRARETLSRRPDRRNPAPHPAGNRGSLGDRPLDAGSRRTAWWKAKSPASFSSGICGFFPGYSGIYRDLVGTSMKSRACEAAAARNPQKTGIPAGPVSRNRPDAPRGGTGPARRTPPWKGRTPIPTVGVRHPLPLTGAARP